MDGSNKAVTVGLDNLLSSMAKLPAGISKKLSGTQVAAELTNEINRAYGDEKPFNFSTLTGPTFSLSLTNANGTVVNKLAINLSAAGDMRNEDLVREVQN